MNADEFVRAAMLLQIAENSVKFPGMRWLHDQALAELAKMAPKVEPVPDVSAEPVPDLAEQIVGKPYEPFEGGPRVIPAKPSEPEPKLDFEHTGRRV